MILVDDRGHTPPLVPYFDPYGLEIVPTIMESGDIMFAGNGPQGTVSIVMERKRIDDLASSVRSHRLGGFQLDGLLEADYPFIIVEGIYRPSKTGLLEVMRGGGGFRPSFTGMMYSEVQNFLTTMSVGLGIRILRTTSPEETAHCVVLLHNWFQKEWSDHKAHESIYTPIPERNGHKATLSRRKPSLCVKLAAQFPGIDQKAWQVGDYFHHDEMALMDAVRCKNYFKMAEALGIKTRKSRTIERIFGRNNGNRD